MWPVPIKLYLKAGFGHKLCSLPALDQETRFPESLGPTVSDTCFALYVLFTWAGGLRGHFPYAEMEVGPPRAAAPPRSWQVLLVSERCAGWVRSAVGDSDCTGPEKFEVESP